MQKIVIQVLVGFKTNLYDTMKIPIIMLIIMRIFITRKMS
jgi:hypothetical protein